MEELKERLRSVISQYPLVRLCIVFGSAASGRLTSQSDLDIAVAAEAPLPPEDRLELLESISDATRREVDLIDLNVETGPILKQVLSKGVIVQNADKSLYAGLISRMLFREADMMPYYYRTLRERRERFIHG
jgi:predicted nucleotidyltransferase